MKGNIRRGILHLHLSGSSLKLQVKDCHQTNHFKSCLWLYRACDFTEDYFQSYDAKYRFFTLTRLLEFFLVFFLEVYIWGIV